MSQDLSLNDIVMPKCYTRALWIYDYKIDDLEKPLIGFLKQYCPTAFGQIVYDDTKPNSGRLVDSTAESSRIFSRAEQPDTPVAHYINCDYQDLDVFPYSAIPTDTSPLFFLHQITVRDGTLLAIGVHHHFTDGLGFFTLIDRFSKWIRQRDDPEVKTFNYDRSLLKPATDIRYEHIEYTTTAPNFAFKEIPSMDVIVKKFNKQQLFTKLNISSNHVTFNDVLIAWLTRMISQIRQIPSNEIINIGMASDGRNELGLSSDYFGNCNFFICFQLKMIDLLTKSVTELAEQVNIEKKPRMNKDYMTSAMAWVKNASSTVYPGFNSFLGKDLAFTNWSRFPAYRTDFGQGSPRRVSLPPARWDGLVLILPTATDEVELYIGLKHDHANELRQKIE